MASAEDGGETDPNPPGPPPAPHAAGPWASPAPDVTAAFPIRIGWGFFRWTALLGLLVMGVGLAWINAADRDPVVELTVLHEEDDGRCTVSWTVPWDGTERTGPFPCDPQRDPLLGDWEIGYLVASGPWKGDLYDRYGEGTVADEVNGHLALGGFGLAGAGVLGGLTRWSLRVGRRKPDPRDGTPPPATAGSPGTASAAADGQPPASPAVPRVSLVKVHDPAQPQPVEPVGQRPGLRPEPGAGAAPSRKPRRVPGLFRWAVLLGVLVTGTGLGGYVASGSDPKVELTVHDKDSLGRCTVSWTDPGSGTRRTTPFRCDPDPETPVRWERGWVVAYGPWKGDLYDEYGEGTPAFEAYAILTVSGLAGAGAGLLGGGIRWTRRWMVAQRALPAGYGPGAPVPGTAAADGYGNPFAGPAEDTGTPYGTSARTVPPSYAVLAAEAERQALPRPAKKGRWRPEADVRKVPWWRVRSLLDVSLLPPAVLGPGIAVAVTVLYVLRPEDATVFVVVPAAAGAVIGAVQFFRALTRGIPLARRLARAARAPAPVPKRYVLLYDPYGGLPNLLFFPAHGGPDDLPEAVLTVLPPGRGKHLGLGLPAPVGEAELHGRLDTPPLVVPWIEGRPLWPHHPYEELSAHGPRTRALMARLTAGATGPGGAPVSDRAAGTGGDGSSPGAD